MISVHCYPYYFSIDPCKIADTSVVKRSWWLKEFLMLPWTWI